MRDFNLGCTKADLFIRNDQVFFSPKLPIRTNGDGLDNFIEHIKRSLEASVLPIKAYLFENDGTQADYAEMRYRGWTKDRWSACYFSWFSPTSSAWFKACYPNEWSKLRNNQLFTNERSKLEFGLPKLVSLNTNAEYCPTLPSNLSTNLVNYINSSEYNDLRTKFDDSVRIARQYIYINAQKIINDYLDALGVMINQYPNMGSFYRDLTNSEVSNYRKIIDELEAPIKAKWLNPINFTSDANKCSFSRTPNFELVAYFMFKIFKGKGSSKVRNLKVPQPILSSDSTIESLASYFEQNARNLNSRDVFTNVYNALSNDQKRELILSLSGAGTSALKERFLLIILCVVLSKFTEFEDILVRYVDWINSRTQLLMTRSIPIFAEGEAPTQNDETEISEINDETDISEKKSNTILYVGAFVAASALGVGVWALWRRKQKQ